MRRDLFFKHWRSGLYWLFSLIIFFFFGFLTAWCIFNGYLLYFYLLLLPLPVIWAVVFKRFSD